MVSKNLTMILISISLCFQQSEDQNECIKGIHTFVIGCESALTPQN